MKKYFTVVVLIGLVIWGFYIVQNSDNASNRNAANASQNQHSEGLEVGSRAPDFELPSVDGNSMMLSSLKGKKVILNFWASWCPPCRLEMPDMAKFYSDQQNNGIVILAVNLTDTEKSQDDVTTFMKNNNITFPVVLDEKGKAAQLYNVASIPASFIIDSQGIIQKKLVGPMTYDSMNSLLSAIK